MRYAIKFEEQPNGNLLPIFFTSIRYRFLKRMQNGTKYWCERSRVFSRAMPIPFIHPFFLLTEIRIEKNHWVQKNFKLHPEALYYYDQNNTLDIF